MSDQQLTIEHLAPYLPYGVKCSNSKKSYLQIGKDRIGVLQQISVNDDSLILNEGGYFLVHYSEIIPILRPLSDLTNLIEHNGEKFVPLIKMGLPNKTRVYNDITYIIKKGHTPYIEMQKLLEWHFDVFSLIDKGLAINSNEVK